MTNISPSPRHGCRTFCAGFTSRAGAGSSFMFFTKEGTYSENMQDAAQKGRLALQQPGRIKRPNGVNAPSAKLTPEKVKRIRELAAQGESQRHLAALFGISQVGIGLIVRRINWKHI